MINLNPSELIQFYHDDLPGHGKNREEKSFKVPKMLTIEKILVYLFKDMGLSKYCIKREKDQDDATKYLELLLKSNLVAPEDDQP